MRWIVPSNQLSGSTTSIVEKEAEFTTNLVVARVLLDEILRSHYSSSGVHTTHLGGHVHHLTLGSHHLLRDDLSRGGVELSCQGVARRVHVQHILLIEPRVSRGL